jgi:hypothetical protein
MIWRGLAIGWALIRAAGLVAAVTPCRIDVIEQGSGWPVRAGGVAHDAWGSLLFPTMPA